MEKRTERNKEIYADIDQRISECARGTDNSEFNHTINTLGKINPKLFSDGEEQPQSTKDNDKKKNIIITACVFSIIMVIIIVMAVIIWQQN